MSKHPLDRDRSKASARCERFAQVERSQRPTAAAKALQQRPRIKTGLRLEKFAMIERGIRA